MSSTTLPLLLCLLSAVTVALANFAVKRGGDVLSAAATPLGDGRLEVRLLSGDDDADLAFVSAAMAHLLALDIDLGGFYALLAADQVLADAVGHLRGLRPPRAESVFEALVVAIIGILAAIAIPQYSAYTNRAKATDALSLMSAYKTAVREYISSEGIKTADM